MNRRFAPFTKWLVPAAAACAVVLYCSAAAIGSDSTAERVGVWKFKEGFISDIIARDDHRIVIYVTNPEGAAIWELDIDAPSKRKLVPGAFLENLVTDPLWLTNVRLTASSGFKYIFIRPLSMDFGSPKCILLHLDENESTEAIPLKIPASFEVESAAFSPDEKKLLLTNRPSGAGPDEMILFDLDGPKILGMLEPAPVSIPQAPALISAAAFDADPRFIWLSAGLYDGRVFDPPVLVKVSVDGNDDSPWIQGNIIAGSLMPEQASVWLLLDPAAAGGAAGLNPNNWWEIDLLSRLAKRPCAAEGVIRRIWPLADGLAGAEMQIGDPSPKNGDASLVLIDGKRVSELAAHVRLTACSPQGRLLAGVAAGGNRLEVFVLKNKTKNGGENGA